MKLLHTLTLGLCSLSSLAIAASSWSFDDATLSIQTKGAGIGGGVKEKLSPNSPLTSPLTLAAGDTLKILLTATESSTARRPHQAFLTLHEPGTGLEESFPFSMKENGKGKVEITQKDLPFQFLTTTQPLRASLLIASFGSSTPYQSAAFTLTTTPDTASPPTAPPAPERYGPQPEISHIFRSDPKSPPMIISLVFSAAILATLPLLLALWSVLGGNVDHAGKAFGDAPVAHGVFLGSVLAMEGVFGMYYLSWNLFQTLPVAAVVGLVGYVSGSRALSEVQDRRVKGER